VPSTPTTIVATPIRTRTAIERVGTGLDASRGRNGDSSITP
jgi:hypothetical protein